MTTYLDTSVLVKLLVTEAGTPSAQQIWTNGDQVACVPLIGVEARSALAAARRANRLTPAAHRLAKASLDVLLETIDVVELSSDLLEMAADLAETERLRGYDAVHLAGAVTVADVLASSDADLCAAAQRLGLRIANPLD